MKNSIFITCIGVLLLLSCNRNPLPATDPVAYKAEIEAWKANRISNLKAKDGWLNLAGLYWLHEGLNTFGSDTSNTIVFPAIAPARIGILELRNDTVYLRSAAAKVLIDSLPAGNTRLNTDASDKPDVMTLNTLAWHIIKRGDRYGIRLRDYASAMIDSLKEIPCFEISDSWRIRADFKRFEVPEKHMVPTIIGTEEENLVPGMLTFSISGKKMTLYPFLAGDRFFIVFGDLTNGSETYPAGRFLYTDGPDEDNQVIIDFNRAYNPPCAFTPYATCPLPLRANILPARIEAGEKAVHLFSMNH
jgi:uncharacterized protein